VHTLSLKTNAFWKGLGRFTLHQVRAKEIFRHRRVKKPWSPRLPWPDWSVSLADELFGCQVESLSRYPSISIAPCLPWLPSSLDSSRPMSSSSLFIYTAELVCHTVVTRLVSMLRCLRSKKKTSRNESAILWTPLLTLFAQMDTLAPKGPGFHQMEGGLKGT
jgi:hypothetical protein